MRVAGVDPGTIQTGVGILEGRNSQCVLVFSKTIHTGRGKTIAERLEIIYTELKAIFAEWKPDVVALENVFYQKDFKAAIKVGEARAAAMLAASAHGISVLEYPPARVKQSVCGNGRATKDQVQYMVRQILKFRGELSADSADAAAVALCHVHSQRFNRIRKELTHV